MSNSGQLGHNLLKKRKPTEANLQTLSKTKNVGQFSFADDMDTDEIIVRPKKEKKTEEEKKEPVLVEEPIAPKAKVNLLEEDEETKRQKQEALEVSLA